MKQVMYVLLVLLFCACRKTRICECITTNQSTGEQVTTTSEFRDTKKNAEDLCSALNKNEGDFITECSLK